MGNLYLRRLRNLFVAGTHRKRGKMSAAHSPSILRAMALLFICQAFIFQGYGQIFSNPITDANPSNYNPFTIGQVVTANATATGIGRGSGISGNAGSNRYNTNNWGGSFDATDYFTFSMAPNAGYVLNFTSFDFTLQRSSTGPNAFSVRSSADGFVSDLSTISYTGTSASAYNVTLSVPAFQNITGTIEFRIYGWGATAAGGTVSVNDFSFNGTCTQSAALSSDSPADFGNVCINTTTASNLFTVTGINLSGTNVQVGPKTGFLFSSDNASFGPQATFSMPGNSSRNFYVKFNPTVVQSYTGTFPVSGGGATAINVPVSGNGVNTLPTINNGSVSAITTSGATISAIISAIGCTAISGYGIEYSTTAGFTNGTGIQVPSSNLSGGNFSVILSGLVPPGQTFYFHTYATNGGGTVYGAENSFTLTSSTPTLNVPGSGVGSLSPFGNICINGGIGSGSFNLSGSLLNGSNITIGPLSGFSFSLSSTGPFTSTLTLTSPGAGYSYSGGTLSGCTIYVRFLPVAVQSYNGNIPVSGGGAPVINVAASGAGINTSASVSTGSALFIATDGAILPATITDAGCGSLLSYGIEYSTTSGFTPGTGIQSVSSNLAGSDYTVQLTGLLANTTYYYYAYVTTASGTVYGTINSFVTGQTPTKLIISSINPGTPTANTGFSITVTAVDNLVDRTPIAVTANTNITLTQIAGIFTLNPPAIPAGTIPAGASSVTITGITYTAPDNGVGVRATAVSGMVSLGNSQDTSFDVIAYSGPSTFVWNNSVSTAWLTGSNWVGGTNPGLQGISNNHLASFTSQSTMPTSGIGGVGINMANVSGNFHVGAIYVAETYTGAHTGNFAPIGNSSGGTDGTLYLHGAPLNNVGGISGNNTASLLIGNYMSDANTRTLDIRNSQGGQSRYMILNVASSGSIIVGAGRFVTLSTLVTGTADITLSGGGTLTVNPSGQSSSINTLTGTYTIANGSLVVGNTGAFRNTTPYNTIIVGSAPNNSGSMKLNGNSVTIAGLSSVGTGSNVVDNGSATATLTINTAASTSYLFGGSLNNGIAGTLNLVKAGAGTQILSGLCGYTGITTISAGKLVLSNPGGATLPSGNSISITGGTLQVSSDQTINNLTATTGTIIVDAGVTLTITGAYTPGPGLVIIQNNGTIRLQGGSPQSFPGTSANVTAMNNLTINNLFGVSMNKSLNIAGVLTLTGGTFTVGSFTLTINNPIAGTPNNLAADQTSSIVIAGTAANVNLPSSVSQLNNFTVSNSNGTTLQGNLNVKTLVAITAAAGKVSTGLNTFNGTANLSMNGGNLYMEKNGVTLPEFTGAYNLTGGTVTFAGVGIASDAQTVRPVNYFNLASDQDGDRVLSNFGTIGVASVFTPSTSPYSNAYTITGSTVDFNRVGSQNIPAFTFYNVRFSGGGAVTKNLAGHIKVENSLVMATNTRLSLGSFNVTLVSTLTNTARVDQVPTANSFIYGGSGRFVVERFISTGVNHAKGWQLLSTPAYGQTIKQAWQEGAAASATNPNPGYGIQITSDLPNATSLGFDIQTPVGSGPGMKTYDAVNNTWVGVPNTNAQLIANKKGYMVFVRGDRSVTTSAQAATPVILRTTGRIYSPGADAPATTAVSAGKYESVGNPYASAIDFTSVQAISTGIDTKFQVWDPLMYGTYGYGGFQLISSANLYKPVPGGTANYPSGIPVTTIQSGQAFFVYSTPGGTVNFDETNKTPGSSTVFRGGSDNRSRIESYLYSQAGNLVDGNLVIVDDAFDNRFDEDDAAKMNNFGEGFGIDGYAKPLILDARHDIRSGDTVHFRMQNLRSQNYQIRIAFGQFESLGLEPVLEDRFTGNKWSLRLSDTNRIDFTVTQDPGSRDVNRFFMIFKNLRPVPLGQIDITAVRTRNNSVSLTWTASNEQDVSGYYLERSLDGSSFAIIHNRSPRVNNGSVVSYAYDDQRAGEGSIMYRVRAKGTDGRDLLSPVARVSALGNGKSEIVVSPNPVVGKQVNIRYEGLTAGKWQASLINKSGQAIWKGQLSVQATSGQALISLPEAVPAASYTLILVAGGESVSTDLLIQ